MKNRIAGLILTLGLLFPLNAHAFFFSDVFDSMFGGATEVATTMVEGATSVANNMVDAGDNTAAGMMSTMLELSDDIGTMSDRILTMADKIGEMSDRIVKTEEMMLKVMNSENIGSSNNSGASLMIRVLEESLSNEDLPQIQLNMGSDSYLLYVSSSIFNADSSSVQIKNSNDLAKFWPFLKEAAVDNRLYIAVKAVNGSELSALSNSVEIYIY